jgi:hypothetical protein
MSRIMAVKQAAFGQLHFDDRDFDGNVGAVGAQGLHFDELVQHGRLAGLQIALHARDVGAAIDGRHDQLGQRLADRSLAGVAEDARGGVVELDDPAFDVDADDGVEGGIENGAHARFAGAQIGLDLLAVGDLAQRSDQARGAAVLIKDQAADHDPALPHPRIGEARLELELARPIGDATVQILLPPHRVGRQTTGGDHPVRSVQAAFRHAQNLVEPRRQIGALLDQVPIPQPVIGAARGQGITLPAAAQLFVRLGSLDGAGNQGGRRLQHLDLQVAPLPFLPAVVEAKKTPDARAQHDRDGDEGLGAVLQECLPGLAGHVLEGRLDDLAAPPGGRPFVQLAFGLEQRDVVIARIGTQPGEAGIRPVISAALRRLVIRPLMDLEQGDAGDLRDAAQTVEQFLDAGPPIGAADDLGGGIADGVEHRRAPAKLHQCDIGDGVREGMRRVVQGKPQVSNAGS